MKNLFNATDTAAIQQRLAQLQADSPPIWGKMNPAQALEHCARSMETATGDLKLPRMLIGRVIGPMVKRKVVADDSPLGKNTPTAKEFVVADSGNFDTARERLRQLIDRFAAGGPATCGKHPHTFFGEMTPDDWAILMYKHLDHHLRQFGG